MNEDPDPYPRQSVDCEHLRLLAIFHYVVGGVYLFISCFGFIYVALGLMMAIDPDFFQNANRPNHEQFPAAMGIVFTIFGAIFVLMGWTVGGLTIYSGRSIQTRRRRTFSQVMAALNCLFIPFGLILGAFTLVVLSRLSVIKMYDVPPQ